MGGPKSEASSPVKRRCDQEFTQFPAFNLTGGLDNEPLGVVHPDFFFLNFDLEKLRKDLVVLGR